MADTKISAMPNAGTLNGTELIPLVQSGANVKVTLDTFVAYDRAHAAFQDTTTQSGSITVGTAFTFNTTDVSDGVTLVSGSRLTVPVNGVYNFQWSGQFQNVENTSEQVVVWLRIDGVDVPGSSGVISIPARKSAGVYAKLIIGWNYFLTLTAGQYVEIVWLPSIATITVPAFPASVAPNPVYPSTASVIVTVNQVA